MKKKLFYCFVFVFVLNSLAFAGNFSITQIDHQLLKHHRICAVAEEAGKTVWATHNQLVIFEEDGATKTFDSSNSPLIEAATISSVAIGEGTVWVTQVNTTNGYGIFCYDGQKWESYVDPYKEGILNNRIIQIHVDADKVVWFGHEFQGVTRMVEAIPIKFSNQKIMHLFKNRLLSLFMQHTHLWAGSINGIVRYRSEIKSNYYLNIDTWQYPEFPARAAYSISDFGHNQIVAGTDTGIAIFDGEKWSLLKKNAGIKALPVKHLARQGGNLWLGSPVGLQCWHPNQSSDLLRKDSGLPGNQITALARTGTGKILVGTESGAAIIETRDQAQ